MSGYRRREEWRQQRKGRMRGSVVGDTVSSFSLCCIMIAVCHDTAKHTEIVDLQMGSRVCKWGFYGVRSSTTARYVCQPSQQAAAASPASCCSLHTVFFCPFPLLFAALFPHYCCLQTTVRVFVCLFFFYLQWRSADPKSISATRRLFFNLFVSFFTRIKFTFRCDRNHRAQRLECLFWNVLLLPLVVKLWKREVWPAGLLLLAFHCP